MPDLAQWHDWVNTGALGAFAVFVCWLGNRIVTKALTWGERYIKSTESLHDTLQRAEEARNTLCEKHANGIGLVAEAIEIGGTDLRRMKLVAIQACRMCRDVSRREIPDSAAEVDRHCSEIERIIGEA